MLTLLNKISALLSRREKYLCVLIILMMMIGAVLEVLGISLTLPIVALLTKSEIIGQNKYLSMISRLINPSSNEQFILFMCVIVIAVFLLKNIFLLYLTYVQSNFIFRKSAELAITLFKSYLNAPYTFHLKNNSSSLINNILLVGQVSDGVLMPLMMLATELFVVVAIFAMLLVADPIITISLAIISCVVTFVLYYPFRNHNYILGASIQKYGQQSFQHLMQGTEGIKETKVRNCEDNFSRGYSICRKASSMAQIKQNILIQLPRFFIETMVVALGFGTLAIFIVTGTTSEAIILKLSLFTVAMVRIMPSLSRIQYNIVRIRQSHFSFDMVYRDLKELPIVKKDIDNPPVIFNNEININNLSFKYEGTRENIFNKFSLIIPYKSSIGFVGRTGCGKTTLLDIILGLLIPNEGQILVDGRNIEENLSSWQKAIGYVPQFIYLLDDTIKANVAFGVPLDEIDEQRVKHCLKTAQILNFIEGLPNGLNAMVGERGIRLSGGQRQRIGIARAIYHDPKVLILDEATSALDNETESAFIDALNSLQGKLTIIMIAHRLTTVQKCDKIVNL